MCAPERPALRDLQAIAQESDEIRAVAFCGEGIRGRRSVAMIAVVAAAPVTFATVAQSVARALRREAVRRERHGPRFLGELAEMWSDILATR